MREIKTLEDMFLYQCSLSTSLNLHYSALRRLAKDCSTFAELGVYHLGSGFAILQGLSESKASFRSFLCIDISEPPKEMMQLARNWASEKGIEFQFMQGDDFDIDLHPVDMLHIDTFHCYRHLTFELEKFSPSVKKYLLMHDTSGAFGYSDQYSDLNFESRYPPQIDRTKKGLWPAIEDFLVRHSEWELYEREEAGDGYSVLKRKSSSRC